MREKWSQHDDRDKVRLSPVPICIIGSKFDAYANTYESAIKKQLCMALRYIAHSNGCDLVFGSVKEKLPSQLYRSLLMSHIFDAPSQGNMDINHNNALNVRAGMDHLGKIEDPEGAMQRRGSVESIWQEQIERVFQRQPEQSAQQAQKVLAGLSKFTEEKVDNMRRQKDEELEQYIKQTQRAKRFEAKANQVMGNVAAAPAKQEGVKRMRVAAAPGGGQGQPRMRVRQQQ